MHFYPHLGAVVTEYKGILKMTAPVRLPEGPGPLRPPRPATRGCTGLPAVSQRGGGGGGHASPTHGLCALYSFPRVSITNDHKLDG